VEGGGAERETVCMVEDLRSSAREAWRTFPKGAPCNAPFITVTVTSVKLADRACSGPRKTALSRDAVADDRPRGGGGGGARLLRRRRHVEPGRGTFVQRRLFPRRVG